MPIYEYACEKCQSEFEVEQRITEDPLKTCPKCRSRKVKRLISKTSFVLKGGGWYSDLYSSTNKDKKSDSGDSDGASASKSSETKSETKSSDKPSEKTGSKSKGKGKGKGKNAAA